jgi:hypothetical protein
LQSLRIALQSLRIALLSLRNRFAIALYRFVSLCIALYRFELLRNRCAITSQSLRYQIAIIARSS